MNYKPKCTECKHRVDNTCSIKQYDNDQPYVIAPISAFDGSFGNRLMIKTSPRWCPIRHSELSTFKACDKIIKSIIDN